jgi:two-component system NtrC family sensor kinase
VRSVRSFAHAGSAGASPPTCDPLLEDVLHVASAQLRSRVNVMREYDDALPRVVCAPQQLRQVFLNLVVNAAQAVEAGGHVLVATRPDGDHVIVSVGDDGCGIAPELIDRIFDPFFTTKPVGVGTGLGLGIATRSSRATAARSRWNPRWEPERCSACGCRWRRPTTRPNSAGIAERGEAERCPSG